VKVEGEGGAAGLRSGAKAKKKNTRVGEGGAGDEVDVEERVVWELRRNRKR